jgi:hypothetical protein
VKSPWLSPTSGRLGCGKAARVTSPADAAGRDLRPNRRLFPQQSVASLLAAINGAAAAGNIPEEDKGNSATLPMAHALISLPLLRTGQIQNCLHIVHHVNFL